MRKITLLLFSLILLNCNGLQDLEEATVTLEFTHNWDGDLVDSSTFGDFKDRKSVV